MGLWPHWSPGPCISHVVVSWSMEHPDQRACADCFPQRRRAQNRASQRAYRERKDQRIKDLETMLNDAKSRNEVLTQAYATLHSEYIALKSSQLKEQAYQADLGFDPNGMAGNVNVDDFFAYDMSNTYNIWEIETRNDQNFGTIAIDFTRQVFLASPRWLGVAGLPVGMSGQDASSHRMVGKAEVQEARLQHLEMVSTSRSKFNNTAF
jgi:hypothetical protein